MSSFNSRWLGYAPNKEAVKEKSLETPKNVPSKTDKSPEPKPAPALEVAPSAGILPRLPWQLERLISAACADVLPKDTTTLPDGLVPDLNRYVLAWGCSYLVSDRVEAERRLWQVYRAWQGVN